MLQSLVAVSNEALHARIKGLRSEENHALAEIVLHLSEIDRRGIYRDAGYPSLFAYCHMGLGYSEGASARRVRAARCLKDSPELYELIRDGKITLSALAEVAPVMTAENKGVVLELAVGVSKREAERVAARLGAPRKPKRESIRVQKVEAAPDLFGAAEGPRAQTEEKYTFSFQVSKETHDLFEEARDLIGHCGMAEVFERALKEFVGKRKPKEVRRVPQERADTRYVPKAVLKEVSERDEFQCSYVSLEGVRCCERRGLQLDHIVAYARGGSNSAENIRLLCFAHNQLHAEQCFGKSFMAQRRGVESQANVLSYPPYSAGVVCERPWQPSAEAGVRLDDEPRLAPVQ